jgi:hypothetical protein
MKAILKTLSALMIIAVFAFFASCQQKSKLQQLVDEVGKGLPLSCGIVGDFTSIDFNNDSVIAVLTVNEKVMNIDLLSEQMDVVKEGALGIFSSSDSTLQEMLQYMIEEKATLVFKYVGKESGKDVKVSFTHDELSKAYGTEAEQMPVNPREALEEQVELANSQCPVQIDSDIVLDSVKIEDMYVVYSYTALEQLYTLDDLIGRKETVRAQLKSSLKANENTMRFFLNCCVACSKGLGYRYKGTVTGKELFINFEPNELQ